LQKSRALSFCCCSTKSRQQSTATYRIYKSRSASLSKTYLEESLLADDDKKPAAKDHQEAEEDHSDTAPGLPEYLKDHPVGKLFKPPKGDE